jgi:hypothetical protein
MLVHEMLYLSQLASMRGNLKRFDVILMDLHIGYITSAGLGKPYTEDDNELLNTLSIRVSSSI